jgi:phosphohistidine phosphatase SixA
VLLVGHNPTVEETIEMLTGSSDVAAMSSCAMVHLNIPIEKWSELKKNNTNNQGNNIRAKLIKIFRPEELS